MLGFDENQPLRVHAGKDITAPMGGFMSITGTIHRRGEADARRTTCKYSIQSFCFLFNRMPDQLSSWYWLGNLLGKFDIRLFSKVR